MIAVRTSLIAWWRRCNSTLNTRYENWDPGWLSIGSTCFCHWIWSRVFKECTADCEPLILPKYSLCSNWSRERKSWCRAFSASVTYHIPTGSMTVSFILCRQKRPSINEMFLLCRWAFVSFMTWGMRIWGSRICWTSVHSKSQWVHNRLTSYLKSKKRISLRKMRRCEAETIFHMLIVCTQSKSKAHDISR